MANTSVESKGLVIGPQNPDSSAGLTSRLGVHNKADKLLQRHAANWPIELTQALSRPRDDERSEALDLEEVEDALRSLRGRRAFFEDDDEFVDASVRGSNDKDRVVSVVYRKPSGRLANGVIPYDGLDASVRAYEDAKARRDGVPFSAQLGSFEDDGRVAELEQAARDAETARRDAEQRAAELEERLARLENPEPFEGYDKLRAQDRAARVADGGLQEFGRAGLERIRTYEESKQQPSVQVIRAVDDALASAPKD